MSATDPKRTLVGLRLLSERRSYLIGKSCGHSQNEEAPAVATARSNRTVPKPFRFGGLIAGPPRSPHLKTRMGSAALASSDQWTHTGQTKTRVLNLSRPLLTTAEINATLAEPSMMRSCALAKAVLDEETAKAEHLWRE